MEKDFEVFLPTSQEITEMSQDEFEAWIHKAFIVLQERKIQRDPLSHLRKRISQILDGNYATEALREEAVLQAINSYYKRFNS